jgi:hypothetical protein
MRICVHCVKVVALVCAIATSCCAFAAESPASAPNSDSTHRQLRNITLSGEAVSVGDLTLRRDAATFHLHSGTICFVPPVQGKVTGAVFVGEGVMILDPPLAVERSSLKLLTRGDEFAEQFNKLVLRFTDASYDEIKKAGTTAPAGCDAGLLRDTQNAMRHNRVLKYNLDARILQDVLSAEAGGLFVAFIHGKKYNDKEIFAIDPHGAPPLIMAVAPEEVELITYDESRIGVWASFHLSSEYTSRTASGSQKNGVIHIEHQQIDTTIEKNANLSGKATTGFVAASNGLRVVPFNLHNTLRVQGVTGEGGEPLSFIQEDKNDDADFYVILPKPLSRDEKYSITTRYGGKEAVINEGNGNYYPIAREDWYPSDAGGSLGEYSSYDLTFRIPKGMKMAATGSLVSENTDGNQSVTVWKSDAPQPVAGFQFGKMKVEEAKLASPEFLVSAYANEEPPDWAHSLEGETMGTMSTIVMMKQPLKEAEFAIGLYTNYFGPLPFKRLSMTQQTACNYGQSWPELVWLPICSFYDITVRHQLGLDWGDRGYWKVVAPHEVAHQWWGQVVGFNSYRDQWMSEGFADFSASLFLQSAYAQKGPKEFITFWDDERKSILEKNAQGFRPIDVGPLTMGYRLNNSRTGVSVTRDLIYPKGAYVLHMIRMMLWDRRSGDDNFRATMQDFVKTFAGRAATTEDFKAIVEKHMTKEMDLEGNQRMDWFFNQYVYGTALPSYKLDYSFGNSADGVPSFTFKLTQSNVDGSFHMLVPIYLELADGRITQVGRARISGNSSVEHTVPLNGIRDHPRRAVLNYYDDVLASP